jgi:hypothetical protein
VDERDTEHAPGDGSANLVAASYAGEPTPLQTGVLYFVALNIPEIDNPLWLGDGSSSGPLFGAPNEGSPWNSLGPGNLQFQVFGAVSAGAPVPEPRSWILLALGFGLAGFGARRARRYRAAC